MDLAPFGIKLFIYAWGKGQSFIDSREMNISIFSKVHNLVNH